MKKTLLLLFALIVSVGMAWGQTNLSQGKHVYPAGSRLENVTEDALQGITNGNEDDEINISKWESPYLSVQSFYIDLGETQEIGSVKIIWQGAAAHAYKIYAATEKVGDAEPTWGTTEIGEQTNVTRWDTPKIELTNEFNPSVNARYIKIEITDPSGNQAPDWGVKIREMKVYSPFVSQLSTISLSNYIAKANTGLGLSISTKDQVGDTFTGNVTLTISPAVSNANINNNTKYIAFPGDITAGTYTITATDANSNTALQKIVFVDEAAPNPTKDNSNVHAVYSETYSATSPGISDPTWNWKYTNYDQLELTTGDNCYRVHNIGTFGLNNAGVNVSDYKYLHLDIYSVENVEGYVNVDASDITNKPISLIGGQWNQIDIDLSSCSNLNAPTWIHIYVGNSSSDNQRDVLIDNVYFWKEASSFTLTATPGTNTLLLGGSTTSITTTVTESGNDVTSSSTITYTSDNTEVIEVSNAGVVTAKGPGNAKITVSATHNENNTTKDIDFTVLLPEQTPPTEDYNNVLVVFSNVYHQGNDLDNTNPTYGRENSPFTDKNIYTTVNYPAQENNHKVVHVLGAGVNGQTKKPTETTSGSANNMTGYYKVHFYVWPTTATKGEVFADNKYPTAKASFSGLTPGQWNPVTVNIDARATAFGEKNYIVVYFMQEDGTMETEFYLDHFYLSKLNDSEAIMTINGNVANVIGSVTESYLTTLNTVTAQVLDLTGVTSYTATSAIETTNPNTLIFIPGTAGDSFTPTFTIANTKNVIGKDGYNFPITPIEYIDIPQYQPWAGTINNFSKYGQSYTVKREIAANKYVTTCLPMSFVIPEGLSVYALDVENSTTSSVKFNKITEGIVANSPYILHNYTDSPVQLEASRTTGDFNLSSETAGTINFASTATFKGNYSEISGDGTTMYGLSGSTGAAPVFRPIGTGAKIGAYRAYFTGLTAAATARFFDGETTKIGTINANGEIEVGTVYNLAGQRVQNPTKGIYIINGKKVVLK